MKKPYLSCLIMVECLLFVVFGIFPWFSIGQPVQEGAESGRTIGEIKVIGNRSVTEADVLSRIRSRIGQKFNPDEADEDAKHVAELTGVEFCYYSTAMIENKIELTFVVVEKNIIRAIVFIGNEGFKSGTLTQKLDFKLGDYLDPLSVRTSEKAIVDFYKKKGYPYVKVSLDGDRLSEGRIIYRIEEGPRVLINSVKYSGNKQFKTSELKKIVKTKKKKLLVVKKYYVPEEVEKDVSNMLTKYYERGFLDCKVTADLKFSEDKTKVDITFVIEEGVAYQLNSISITGNKEFTAEELSKEFKLEQNSTYNEKKSESDLKKILSKYRENGFIEVNVEKKKEFIGSEEIDLIYNVNEGDRFRIGRINITGNKETKDKVVRHVLDEYDFQPGKWWNADIARGDGTGYLEKLVQRTAISEDATIIPSGTAIAQRDAQVNITETQSGMILLGAGVGSDSGVVGQLIFEQRNFDIKDKPKNLWELLTGQAFKGAGQSLRLALEPGTEYSRYSITFNDPYWQDKPISFDMGASNFMRGYESYDEERMKGMFGFEKRYKNKWRRSISFRAENVDVTSLDTDAPREVIDDKGENSIFGVRLGIGKDMRDDIFNPSDGYSFNMGYEQVAGDHTFGVLDAVYRRYVTLHEDLAENKTVLAVKILGATILGDAPVFEKFYAGGSGYYGIRGFEFRGVSTRGLQTNVANPERKDPIGSDWIFLANGEITIPLGSETFSWLLFLDSGLIDSGGYRASAGVGIQILMPQWFGPVPMRFELATPIMKDGDDDTQAFSFSVGRLF